MTHQFTLLIDPPIKTDILFFLDFGGVESGVLISLITVAAQVAYVGVGFELALVIYGCSIGRQ